ncbi:MAG: type I 3-dehydroquinate dehydratase [Methanobacterium sp.]|uniref:type I 3-dehydroquinate dehydratase n=1 Tax=Methanobacterium sp. TaxID=2164 RepID=UPI003D66059E|nr:type I 3-dehydroquinate dehydratase [Methanobacterium sp.]
MFKKPMICAPIIEKESESVLKSAKKAISLGADILEFRIDAIENPDIDEITQLIKEINYPLIATNRIPNEGGFFKGSEEDRTSILKEAAKYADIVDIELCTDEDLRSKVIKASKSTIISYHDFKKTPSFKEILGVVEKEKEIGDIAKFAVMPHNKKDTLTVLKVLSEVQNTIGIAMGDIGRYTRIVAPIFGSPITFASIDTESAPGQLDIITTKNILRNLAVID